VLKESLCDAGQIAVFLSLDCEPEIAVTAAYGTGVRRADWRTFKGKMKKPENGGRLTQAEKNGNTGGKMESKGAPKKTSGRSLFSRAPRCAPLRLWLSFASAVPTCKALKRR
jgi:hypothetical protein